MSLLVGVLLKVRARGEQRNIRGWTVALLLILLECAARILYGIPTGILFHRTMHAIALGAYLLAGVAFVRSGSAEVRRMPRSLLFLWLNMTPLLVLMVVYAMDIRTQFPYILWIFVGVVTSFVTCALFRRSKAFYWGFVALWAPVAIAASTQSYRATIYFILMHLYGLAALVFAHSLPKGSRGKIAVVAGFTMWSLCFATHPWVMERHVDWVPFLNEVWNMQKFIITVGLLLVMLERQIRSSEWLALHDELTGLPNRRLFDDRLQTAVARAERYNERVALFTVDLDGFKGINDTLGHDAGDVLLQHVARNLESVTRRTDTLARQGGDEFSLIVLNFGVGADNAKHPIHFPHTERIFETILQAVERPVEIGEGDTPSAVQISASIGVAVFPDDARDVHALIRLADLRMYQQKAARAAARKAGTSPDLVLTSK
jgi:diguanylate cyclase (GGDEF)-like protein